MAIDQTCDAQPKQPGGRGSHFLSDAAVAERYGVTRQAVWRWSKAGHLPAPVKLSAGCTRWKLADLEAFEASREAVQ